MSPPTAIAPVHRSTLGELVTERLREAVTDGRFAPGTQLSEVELAAQFRVSRGPVREALQHLAREGLLRREPGRGISVPRLDAADIADLYFARETIEAAAMRIVLQGDPAQVVAGLRVTVGLMADASASGDWNGVADLDIDFHGSIVAAARSPRLSRAYAGIADESRLYLSITAHDPGRERLVQEHAELLELLEARDTAGVQRALDDHLAHAIATLGRHATAESRQRRDDG